MEKMELAKKVIKGIKGKDFTVSLGAYGGGACGDSWDGEETLYLSPSELYYLIDSRVGHHELFKGLKSKKIDVEQTMYDMAREGAWPDGETEESDYFSYSGKCEAIHYYVDAYAYILRSIMSGEITEGSLDSWLEYFDDSENFEYDIKEWHETDEEKNNR